MAWSRPWSSPLGEFSTKSGSKQTASLSASALLKSSKQECIACSISAISAASEELGGGSPRRATATLQVDAYAQLLQEIHAENSVEWAAARFADCGQVNRRQSDISQTVAAQPDFADRNLAGIQYGRFIPGLDVDQFRMLASE